jgi:ureidoglycolate lyase
VTSNASSRPLSVDALSEAAMAPFGWLLGKPYSDAPGAVAFTNAATDFRREHIFHPGEGGEMEVLWVSYRNDDREVGTLERHLLTQQAVVPLVGSITQILAPSLPDGAPDLAGLRAFHLPPGMGICMKPEVWHATRSAGASCLMLTRATTTEDLIGHMAHGRRPVESELRDVSGIRLAEAAAR